MLVGAIRGDARILRGKLVGNPDVKHAIDAKRAERLMALDICPTVHKGD